MINDISTTMKKAETEGFPIDAKELLEKYKAKLAPLISKETDNYLFGEGEKGLFDILLDYADKEEESGEADKEADGDEDVKDDGRGVVKDDSKEVLKDKSNEVVKESESGESKIGNREDEINNKRSEMVQAGGTRKNRMRLRQKNKTRKNRKNAS